MVLKSGAINSETSESMFSFKMLHSGDRFKFVASQGLENKKTKLKQQNKSIKEDFILKLGTGGGHNVLD